MRILDSSDTQIIIMIIYKVSRIRSQNKKIISNASITYNCATAKKGKTNEGIFHLMFINL